MAPAWALGHVPGGGRQRTEISDLAFPISLWCFNHPLILWIREDITGCVLSEKMKSKATFGGEGEVGYLQGMLH